MLSLMGDPGCLPTTGRLQRKPAPTYWGHSGCIPTLLGHPWGSRGPRGRRQQAEPPQDCGLGPVERAAVGELCPGKRRGGAGRVRTRRRLCFFTAWPPACTAAPPWPPKLLSQALLQLGVARDAVLTSKRRVEVTGRRSSKGERLSGLCPLPFPFLPACLEHRRSPRNGRSLLATMRP